MRIVALDFETANTSPFSGCSLGIAIYQDGEILDNFEWYFKPHHDYDTFTFTYLHGISYEDVENEPEFDYYYDQLAEILKDSIIVAHNAPFDIGVLNAMCDIYNLNHFKNKYLDTVYIARRVFPYLKNHKLNTVSEYLGIDLSHHNGKSDANACLMILLEAMARSSTYDLETFLEKKHISFRKNM